MVVASGGSTQIDAKYFAIASSITALIACGGTATGAEHTGAGGASAGGAGATVDAGGTNPADSGKCELEGGMQRIDACNWCWCGADGTVICSHNVCECFSYAKRPGDTFLSMDGCNLCTCQSSGWIECQVQSPCGGQGCIYDGHSYLVGETFGAADGCNDCVCETAGVGCTAKKCAPP